MIGSSFTRGNNMDRSLMAVEIRAKDAEAMPSNPTSCHTGIVTDNILDIRMLEWRVQVDLPWSAYGNCSIIMESGYSSFQPIRKIYIPI